jgi:DNA-binding transcriptional MerR regulator
MATTPLQDHLNKKDHLNKTATELYMAQNWWDAQFIVPTFTRTEVAQLLNCSPLTISNREKKQIYPEPKRHPTSHHRIYYFQDVLNLQYITNNKQLNISSITSLLWDKGYTNSKLLLPCIQSEVELFKKNLSEKTDK